MSQILDIYTVDSLQPNESVFNSADISWLSPMSSNITNIQVQSYWRPTDALQKTQTLQRKLCSIPSCSLFLLFTITILTLRKMGN